MDSSTASFLRSMNRRKFLQGTSAFAGMSAMGLTGCAPKNTKMAVAAAAPPLPLYDEYTPLVPIRAHTVASSGSRFVCGPFVRLVLVETWSRLAIRRSCIITGTADWSARSFLYQLV